MDTETKELSCVAKALSCCLSSRLFPMEYSIETVVGARSNTNCTTHNLLLSVIAILRSSSEDR